ncbi:MAG: hypothetical protein RL095_326 [Verrucomicrobiota bacterium]|jgi:RNA-binding protein
MEELTGKQRRYLRSLGNQLQERVVFGHAGFSEGLLAELERWITLEELVKIRIQPSSGIDRHEGAEELSLRFGAQVAQVFGNTVLLWRRNEEKPVIKLP